MGWEIFLFLTCVNRGRGAGQHFRLQIPRDIGQVPHQRRQGLLRHCAGDPAIQPRDAGLFRERWRKRQCGASEQYESRRRRRRRGRGLLRQVRYSMISSRTPCPRADATDGSNQHIDYAYHARTTRRESRLGFRAFLEHGFHKDHMGCVTAWAQVVPDERNTACFESCAPAGRQPFSYFNERSDETPGEIYKGRVILAL